MIRNCILISILYSVSCAFIYAQSELKMARMGDLQTTSGQVIKDCKIGYRTVGELNNDRSNAILWPSWFGGTSEEAAGILDMILPAEGKFIILVDALGNGVSSSPSNTPDFPELSIRDMVNSQHKLLTEYLDIDHLEVIFGVSMGGMQALEWAVAYPDFADKVVTLIGTPKQTSFDILVWQTAADLITPNADDIPDEEDYQHSQNIVLMNQYTPGYIAGNVAQDSLTPYLKRYYDKEITAPDYLSQLKAMISHDIYRTSGRSLEDIAEQIRAELFMVVSEKDHLVNPKTSYELQEALGTEVVTLHGDCGHIAPLCEAETVKIAVKAFLEQDK